MRNLGLLLGAALAICPVEAPAKWHEATSSHFTIYADEDPAELKRFGETLERFNAAVRSARGIPDVAPGASSRVTLYVLKDVEAIQKLHGSDHVAGFYMPRASGSVSFVPRKGSKGKWGLSADTIFFHEYVHHLTLGDTDRPLPIWVSEGTAEFFASPTFDPDGSVEFGSPPLYRADVLSPVGALPLPEMLSGSFTHVTSQQYESIYGRGWLLIHYLAFEPKRRGQLTAYLNAIASGIPAAQAASSAFGDIRKLESEIYAYHKRNRFNLTKIAGESLKIPPVSIRALTPAEDRLIDAQIKLARGGKKLEAKALAEQAMEVTTAHPSDAKAHILAAQLHIAADQPEKALAPADKAIALAPQSYSALLARGEALLALAKRDPKAVNWTKVRAALLAANKVDPEAADPLLSYYRSFVFQGVAPTENAVEGLIYALALAPQDGNLRMEVVGHLIGANRLPQAQAALAPLAFDPHKGKRRDSALAIFDALKAGDRTLASNKWSEAQRYYQSE